MQEENPRPDRALSPRSHSRLAALKDSDAGLHGLSIWITQRPLYWSQFVFRYLLRLPHPLRCPLSPLVIQY